MGTSQGTAKETKHGYCKNVIERTVSLVFISFTNYWSTHDVQLGRVVYLFNDNIGIPVG